MNCTSCSYLLKVLAIFFRATSQNMQFEFKCQGSQEQFSSLVFVHAKNVYLLQVYFGELKCQRRFVMQQLSNEMFFLMIFRPSAEWNSIDAFHLLDFIYENRNTGSGPRLCFDNKTQWNQNNIPSARFLSLSRFNGWRKENYYSASDSQGVPHSITSPTCRRWTMTHWVAFSW